MINKITSKELSEVMDTAEQRVSDIQETVDTIRLNIDRQMGLFKNSVEYANSQLSSFQEKLIQGEQLNQAVTILAEADDATGTYDSFGISIHPKLVSTANNVFNFMTAMGPVYKDIANVYVNNSVSPTFENMLIHDAVKGKQIAFDEFTSPDVTLRIEMNPSDLLGATSFNIIELLPYLPGSFDINEIRLYSLQDYKAKNLTAPAKTLNKKMTNVGAERIIMDETFDLYACEIDVHINYKNSQEKFPFGLAHVYFLNASMNRESSYQIYSISREKYIDWVDDSIVVHDQDGYRDTTCTDEGIKLYAEHYDGELSSEIAMTKGISQNTLTRNTHKIYVRVPVKTGIISVRFKNIGER